VKVAAIAKLFWPPSIDGDLPVGISYTPDTQSLDLCISYRQNRNVLMGIRLIQRVRYCVFLFWSYRAYCLGVFQDKDVLGLRISGYRKYEERAIRPYQRLNYVNRMNGDVQTSLFHLPLTGRILDSLNTQSIPSNRLRICSYISSIGPYANCSSNNFLVKSA
jgi:hypothetical protein